MNHTTTFRLFVLCLINALSWQRSGAQTIHRKDTFYYSGQIVYWTVPQGVNNLTITAKGAEGSGGGNGNVPIAGGKGAFIKGNFSVVPGNVFKILVGQRPSRDDYPGGGGGSFVTDAFNAPLAIAGGGGGGGNFDAASKHGQAGTAGGNGAGNNGGIGGTTGKGGAKGGTNGGGGGLNTDGGGGADGGQAFVNGGAGGGSTISNVPGGFGGGGRGIVSGGGGGGYSGGGGGSEDFIVDMTTGLLNYRKGVGGGGGSFNGGTAQENISGVNSGHGLVVIAYVAPITLTWVSDTTVNNDARQCGAIVNFTLPSFPQGSSQIRNETFYYSGQIVRWIVPQGVSKLTITAKGAEGGRYSGHEYSGGLGATIKGNFATTPGSELKILVGGRSQNDSSGGGGGSFITDLQNNPVIIAGGGGGSGNLDVATKHGQAGPDGGAGGGRFPYAGGTDGNGGPGFSSGGGGGLLTNGTSNGNEGGKAFVNGGAGGSGGGFGGGGGSSVEGYFQLGGGGGGYSGGGGVVRDPSVMFYTGVGGGGGSYNAGTAQENIGGVNSGNGLVVFNYEAPLSLVQTKGLPAGALFPVGTTLNGFALVAGNDTLATCSFSVTVQDTTKPTITVPANITVNTDAGKCSRSNVALGTPTASDNCSGNVTLTNNAPAVFPKGTTTITYTATDAAGNQSTATQTVTINDNEKPTLSCPQAQTLCFSNTGSYTIPLLTASDNCGLATTTYIVAGATARSGSGANASGAFNAGTSTITWTVRDEAGNSSTCTTTVTINPQIIVSIPDAKVLPKGVDANTVYAGYAPASAITLTATASGGTGLFTYQWSTGATTPSIKVSPTTNTTYTVMVTNNNCTATATKLVRVVTVSCSGKKVSVCHSSGSLCIDASSVADHLAHGDKLGRCATASRSTIAQAYRVIAIPAEAPALNVYPNPAIGFFTLRLTTKTGGTAQLLITDSKGTTAVRQQLILASGTATVPVDMSGKASGLYLIRIRTEAGEQTIKLMLQK